MHMLLLPVSWLFLLAALVLSLFRGDAFSFDSPLPYLVAGLVLLGVNTVIDWRLDVSIGRDLERIRSSALQSIDTSLESIGYNLMVMRQGDVLRLVLEAFSYRDTTLALLGAAEEMAFLDFRERLRTFARDPTRWRESSEPIRAFETEFRRYRGLIEKLPGGWKHRGPSPDGRPYN